VAEQLTRAEREQLEAELAELEGPRRKAAVEAIAVARAHGDLSENFEYHAAKNEQGLLEARITKLRARLRDAVELDESTVAAGGVVTVGCTVDLEREWKGQPELRQLAFFLELHDTRRDAPKKRDTPPDAYQYRPQARLGDVRLKPLRAVSMPADRWTHVAIVYDRFLIDRLRLYIDGHLVARAVPWGSDPGFADIRSMRLGTLQERNGAYRGMIDEVKLYARALSDEEIAASAARGS